MIPNSARALVEQHLSHLLGCRPSQYEIEAVLRRVGPSKGQKDLERIVREEAARFAAAR